MDITIKNSVILVSVIFAIIYSCSNERDSEIKNLSSMQSKGSSLFSVRDIKIKSISNNSKEIEMFIKCNSDMDENSLLNPNNYSFRSCDDDYYHFKNNNYLEYDRIEKILHLTFLLEKRLHGNCDINEKDYFKMANIFDSEHYHIRIDSDQINISTGEVF